MKSLKYLNVLLFSFLFLFSCSETKVIEVPADQTVDAPAVSGFFKKRVLIEDYTGTWCGYCAGVLYAIEKVHEQTDKAVSVSIHGSGNDPYKYPRIAALRNTLYPNEDSSIYPIAKLNRTTTWVDAGPNEIQQVKNLTGNNCGLGLSMNSTVLNGNVSIDVNIKFAQSYSNLKLVVYLLENNLVHDQTNYTSFYQSQHPIPNFVHNHLLRSSITSDLGESITENTTFGQTINKHFSVAIPSNVANASNISFVAFVLDSNNTVVNSRAADVNETQTFEENP